MKLNFRSGIKILLSAGCTIVAYVVFVHTDLLTPSQKAPPHEQQLKTAIICQVAQDLSIQDTLYVVTQRMLGTCGNDPRYDGVTTFSEKINEIKYNLGHPYILSGDKGYAPVYWFHGKTIITGSSMDNTYSSEKDTFDEDSARMHQILDIEYTSIEREQVKVEIVKYPNEKLLGFTMICKGGQWKPIYSCGS